MLDENEANHRAQLESTTKEMLDASAKSEAESEVGLNGACDEAGRLWNNNLDALLEELDERREQTSLDMLSLSEPGADSVRSSNGRALQGALRAH